MGFYNNRKNEKSSIFMINDPDLHERDDANDKDLKIRYMLIGANIFALILFLVLFNNIVVCHKKCLKYAIDDSGKWQEFIIRADSNKDGVVINSIDEIKAMVSENLVSDVAGKYKVRVNKAKNVVNVLEKGNNGNYDKPIKVMSAIVGNEIKTGTSYKIGNRWLWLRDNNGNYSKFVTQISGNIVFESISYKVKDNFGSLNYVEFDNLGNSINGNFVKLKYADAQWIFDNLSSDTIVEFYEDENPGPLGSPEIKQISLDDDKKNWDPTYSGKESPWNKEVLNSDDNNSKVNKSVDNVVLNKATNKNKGSNNVVGKKANKGKKR